MADQTLRIPQGTEAFYLDEAYSHRQLIRQFEDICTKWAYLPVQTPVFDFFDAYRGLVRSGRESNVYRLIDRDGDLLLLRSDITLFLARQMGLILRSEDLPVRAYYVDTILRHEDPHDLSKNEFYQAGAELIGPTGVEADAEIVLLLLELLENWGAAGAVLHIGTRAFLAGFESDKNNELAAAVAARNEASARALLTISDTEPNRISLLTSLYRFIGSGDELEGFLDSCPKRFSSQIAATEQGKRI